MGMGLTWIGDEIDLSFDANQVESAALISLFTDARVADEELPEGETSPRGFWGDGVTIGAATGSRLWLLAREKATTEVLRLHEDYAREALAWLADSPVATTVDVRGIYDEEHRTSIDVFIDAKRMTLRGRRDGV